MARISSTVLIWDDLLKKSTCLIATKTVISMKVGRGFKKAAKRIFSGMAEEVLTALAVKVAVLISMTPSLSHSLKMMLEISKNHYCKKMTDKIKT